MMARRVHVSQNENFVFQFPPQDACLDKLDRFIRGEAGSLKVDSPHSTRRADSGRLVHSITISLVETLPIPSSQL